MGATGFSIAQFLASKGQAFHVFDTRSSSSMLEKFEESFPESQTFFGDIDQSLVLEAEEIYLSPGVSRNEEVISSAIAAGKSVVGDIDLFLREVECPVIGITGSNGKSTVTTLVGMAAENAHVNVGVGGNIGTPALELLKRPAELYVLELSSFQLESTPKPHLDVACNLNVSADHMDRYEDLNDYAAVKRGIYIGAKNAVYNFDDELTKPETTLVASQTYAFGLGDLEESDLGAGAYRYSTDNGWLTCGSERLIHRDDIKVKGLHNVANALALFAIADAAKLKRDACVTTLKTFKGLSHRCEYITEKAGVTYINDSKATNVGAAVAAIEGLAPEFGGIVLIAGGQGKGAEFDALGSCVEDHVRLVVLLGEDKDKIASTLSDNVEKIFAESMDEAVEICKAKAKIGELVLLSPACASFDMFSSFGNRGDVFRNAVLKGGAL
ncbi:MAG: UDP-N-acetylmuramoyl-L-alanine--D-glutamate ligase [Agarilytica sp.]